jgi:hypothetical protein
MLVRYRELITIVDMSRNTDVHFGQVGEDSDDEKEPDGVSIESPAASTFRDFGAS